MVMAVPAVGMGMTMAVMVVAMGMVVRMIRHSAAPLRVGRGT